MWLLSTFQIWLSLCNIKILQASLSASWYSLSPNLTQARNRKINFSLEKSTIEKQKAEKKKMSSTGDGSTKIERKDKERERRMQMKELCFKLSSLIPNQHSASSKDVMTQKDSLNEAATYISELKERVEKLREIRNSTESNHAIGAALAPVIEVRCEDTDLEVIFVSSLHNKVELHRIIAILDEEGADVRNVNVSVVGDQVFYTIHSQALSSRIGLEAGRVLERLRNLAS